MPRIFPQWHFRHVFVVGCALASLFTMASVARSASPTLVAAQRAAEAVPLFDAIDAGDLEAGVVPRDARQLTVQLKNKTARPLTIQMPPALAAAPVLAQQPGGLFGGQGFGGPGFGNGGNGRGNGQVAPQQLGFGGGQGNVGQGAGFPGGIFNIPAGRVIKIKAPCVCLEYGKPDPDARMKYELKPLSDVNDSPALAAILTSLGQEQVDQRVAQAAAWHVTDDLSWNNLAALLRREVGAYKEWQFTAAEVSAARVLVEATSKHLRRDSSFDRPFVATQGVAVRVTSQVSSPNQD